MYGFLAGLQGYREDWYRDLRELTQGRSFVKRKYRAFLRRGLLRPTKRTYNIGCTILHQRYALFTSFTLCYCILHPFSAGGHFLLRIVGDKAYVKIFPANRVFSVWRYRESKFYRSSRKDWFARRHACSS